jgi:hypothetical protein
MFNIVDRVNWGVWSETLLKGNPPLIVQILAINSIIFIYLIVKKIRQKGPRKASAAHLAQAILIVTNLAILSQDQLRPFYHDRVLSVWNRISTVVSSQIGI